MKPNQKNCRRVMLAALSKGRDSHLYFFAARIQQGNIARDLKGDFHG